MDRSAHAQSAEEEVRADEITEVHVSVDTSWADLEGLAHHLESTATRDSFQTRLVRYGLFPETRLTLTDAALGQKAGEIGPDSTQIDVFYRNLFGDSAKEGILQVRSHRMMYALSFFEKRNGRWHQIPNRIDIHASFFPAPPEPRRGSCTGSMCFDFIHSPTTGTYFLAVEDYYEVGYRGYLAKQFLLLYRVTPTRPYRLLVTTLLKSGMMKSKPWTQERSEATYRWALPVEEDGPLFLALEETVFDYTYSRESVDIDSTGTRWRVLEHAHPEIEDNGSEPISPPDASELEQAGVRLVDTRRRPRVNGSLFGVKQLETTEDTDSLCARLQRVGLLPEDMPHGDETCPPAGEISVDVFSSDLFGDRLREAVVQVRGQGIPYSLAVFEPVPGGWQRIPGLLHVDATSPLNDCAGTFCFRFAEGQAENKHLLSGQVGRTSTQKMWIPIQATPDGPRPLAAIPTNQNTKISWGAPSETAFPRYGLLREPLSSGGTVSSQHKTTLGNDRTGENERVSVAKLAYDMPEPVRTQAKERDDEAAWARGDRTGGNDTIHFPKVGPLKWGSGPKFDYPEDEWDLPRSTGTIESPSATSSSLTQYIHDIRRVIQRSLWDRFATMIAPEFRSSFPPDRRDADSIPSFLRIDNRRDVRAALETSAIDTVAFRKWRLRRRETEAVDPNPVLQVSGTIRFKNGVTSNLAIWLDIRDNHVYIVSYAYVIPLPYQQEDGNP